MRNIGSIIWPVCHSALRVGWHIPRRLVTGLISLYQETLSPDHGPLRHIHPYGFCRHHPTCSEYSKQVIRDRGVFLGLILTASRVVSCNPWVDPHPQRLRDAMEKV
jgi:hypothetical protein